LATGLEGIGKRACMGRTEIMAKRKKTDSKNIYDYGTTKQIESIYTPFKGLKDALEHRRCDESKNNPVLSKTDEEIFLEAMADVREIKEFRKMPVQQPRKIERQRVKTDNSIGILQQIVDGEIKIRLSDTGEYIEWVSPCIRKDIARKLHQGDFSVQDYIDLHGMTLREAEEAFRLFFQQALKRRLFCIKVIHGRGLRSPNGPVLKEALKTWLQGKLRKRILAYSSAKDCDGGLGATYIILQTN
jgi:DNA-nicking Smr family endonuclease